MTEVDTPVVIAGAGIAGAGLALALHRAGIGCVVCEAHPYTDENEGAFLALGSGGVRALQVLDADDAVAAVSGPVRTLRRLDTDGTVLDERPLAAEGAPGYRLLTRAALARALADRATERGVEIRYGAGVTGAVPDGDGVTVTLADSSALRASLLVGADGLHSVVRTAIDPASPPPRPVGQRIYYGFSPARVFDGYEHDFLVQASAAAMFGAFPLPDGTWWFVRRNSDDAAEPPDVDPVAVLRDLLPAGEPAGRAVRAEGSDVSVFDAHDLPFVGAWYSDRMLIVGDAAHTASPATGQGASIALEDVVVLAKALRDNDFERGAAVYERARRGRAQANVLASAAMSRPDRPVTGADPGEALSPEAVLAQLDWDRPLP